MKNALVLALSALVLFLAASTWLALYPTVPVDLGGAHDFDREAKRVKIPVGEGDHLDGWLLPGSRPATIVLFAGYARDHHRMWRYAQFLRRDGYTLLAVDFRSAREHDRKPTTLGAFESEDAEATLRWLASAQLTRANVTGLFGESLGGSVALATAVAHTEVAAVAADCPFATGRLAVRDGFERVVRLPGWPLTPIALALCRVLTGKDAAALDATSALGALDRRPVLLMQTSQGDRFSPEEVRLLEAAAGPGVEGWTVNDCVHNQLWQAHRVEYEARVRAFFAAHLLRSRLYVVERSAEPRVGAPSPARADSGRGSAR
jgi:pimeloyl-ACP methyl ester carboxylesterase